MSRPLRIEFPGAVYHVMNRGSAYQKIFIDSKDKELFLRTLSETHMLWGIEVFAYCLMDNHYHICLRTPEGKLSRVMKHLNGLYTQRFNKIHGRDGTLFRGRYKAILIDADEYLTSVVRYIHLNPVEARCVKKPQNYRWSSHRAYFETKEATKWLNVQEVLSRFADAGAYQEFILSGNAGRINDFYGSGRQGSVLGGERFLDRIRSRTGKLSLEYPRHERLLIRPSADRVVGLVADTYGVAREDVIKGCRGKENEARKVAMYLVKRSCDLTLQEIAERFGVGSYGAVGWACHAIRSKTATNRRFKKKVECIEKDIYQQKI